MQDMTGDEQTAASGEADHAAIVQLLNSEAWTRRLEEARLSRSKILAQKVRPTSAPVFRPAATHRASRQDLLPPLEPPLPRRPQVSVVAERGVVVQFQPPGAVLRPVPDLAIEPVEAELPVASLTSGRMAQIAAAFLCGLAIGALLTALL